LAAVLVDKLVAHKLELLGEVAEVPQPMAEVPIMAAQAQLVKDLQAVRMVGLLLVRME
jgi:hypothetical protein